MRTRPSFPSKNISSFLPRLLLLISLFLMASGLYIDPSSLSGSLLSPQQHLEKTEESIASPSQELVRLLLVIHADRYRGLLRAAEPRRRHTYQPYTPLLNPTESQTVLRTNLGDTLSTHFLH